MVRYRLFLVCVFGSLVAEGGASAATKARPDEAVLTWRERSVHPISVISSWTPNHQAGELSITCSNRTVVVRVAKNGAALWTMDAADADQLEFLSAEGDIAYVMARGAHSVLRLDLANRRWLSQLTFSDTQNVITAGARQGKLFLLTGTTNSNKEGTSFLIKYKVSAFSSGGTELWSNTFDAASEAETRPGAYLLAGRYPNRANSQINHFVFSLTDVLLCAGPREKVICMTQNTGDIRWSVERIWEFERGFIGPSVWSHFISRFGADDLFSKERPIDPASRKAFAAKWDCDILGGPLIVPRPDSSWDSFHVFIAASRRPKDGERSAWGSYLSDCVVYELDSAGKPVSMATLPRLVNGSKAIVLSRSVVWSGQNNSILRLAIWEDEHSINRGPGSFDRTTRVTWYREFEGDNEGMVFFTNKMQPWLSVDKAGDPVGFGTSHAFKTLVGGYVENQQDKLFNFPITAIDYTNGVPEDMLLKVPLNTSVPLPETNISSTGNSHHTYGPYYMGITGLEADGNRLTIVIGEAGSAFGLVFDLNESK